MKSAVIKRITNLIVSLVAIALYVVHFVYVVSIKKGQEIAVIGFSVLGLLVSYVLTCIIHELGHILLGLIFKLKLCYVKIFGLHFYKSEEGKLKVALSRNKDIFGETAFYSLDSENAAKKICFDNTFILCTFGISFIVPLYVFVINIIPFSYDYDGSIMLTMLSGDKKSHIASSYVAASSLIASGVSPEELNGKHLAVYDEDYGFYSVKIIRLRYLSVLVNDENTAFRELDKISNLSLLPDGTYAEVLYELFFKALVLEDDNFIKLHSDDVFEYLDEDDSPTSFRVQTAYCIYKQEFERAKLLVESGLKICDTYENKGIAKLEKQLLERFNDVLINF